MSPNTSLKRSLIALLFSMGLFSGLSAQAQEIFSLCPVVKSIQEPGRIAAQTIDRFRPEHFRDELPAYHDKFPKLVNYLAWLLSVEDPANDPSVASSERTGLLLEDMELVNALGSEPSACHDARELSTQALAIRPYAIKRPGADGQPLITVRFKVCEYYADNERQLFYDEDCMIIGREAGYTFTELANRNQILDQHVRQIRDTIESATIGAGVIAAIPIFRTFRMAKGAEIIVPAVAASIPVGISFAAVRFKYTDQIMQNTLDFKDASEIALTGDLTTTIKVNMPMQNFIPYYQRFLESMD